MTTAEMLADLKIDLQISSTALDGFLGNLLTEAQAAIAGEGITLTRSVADSKLMVHYAAYLYRARRGEMPQMPRYLRYLLNNRLMSEKGAPPWTTC